MVVCVTGCGPTLDAADVPENAFVIGVNNSYELIEPHIMATAAYESVFTWPGPTIRRDASAPRWTAGSGCFAMWVASLFKPERIVLTGFGGEGHFDGTPSSDAAYYTRELKKAYDHIGVPVD